MSLLSGKGFIIDKSPLNDKKLIIRVLTDSDDVFSAVFYRGKKGQKTPNHLDSVEYQLVNKSSSDLFLCKELVIRQSFVPLVDREIKSDYYFFIAEVIRVIGRRVEVERGLFALMEDFYLQFKSELPADLLISFLLKLLDVFGVLPTRVNDSKYLDFRDGCFVFSVPGHPDFCDASSIMASYDLLNENSSFSIHSNSKIRLDVILSLLRYFEVQKGIALPLNSIEILRDLR